MAVVDVLDSGFEGTRSLERFGGTRAPGTRLRVTVFGRNPVVGGHPLARDFVGDDAGAGGREHLVVAGLIGVIVRVEERPNLRTRRHAAE